MARPGLNQVVPKYHDTEQEGSKHHQEKKSGVRFIVLPSSHDKSMPYSMRNVKVESMREIELTYRCGRFCYASENYLDWNTVAKRVSSRFTWEVRLIFFFFSIFVYFSSPILPYLGFHRLGWAVIWLHTFCSAFIQSTVVNIDREHCVSGHTFYREAL